MISFFIHPPAFVRSMVKVSFLDMPMSVEIHVFTVFLCYCFMLSSYSLIFFEYFEMVDIFQEAGLPLWLRPYEVLVTSSYTALIETIPDTVNCCFFS